jgi:hypothetical protein
VGLRTFFVFLYTHINDLHGNVSSDARFPLLPHFLSPSLPHSFPFPLHLSLNRTCPFTPPCRRLRLPFPFPIPSPSSPRPTVRSDICSSPDPHLRNREPPQSRTHRIPSIFTNLLLRPHLDSSRILRHPLIYQTRFKTRRYNLLDERFQRSVDRWREWTVDVGCRAD